MTTTTPQPTTPAKPMNKFELASLRERELMTKFFEDKGITQYTFSPISGYARWDGTFVAINGDKFVFEVKVRNMNHDKYATSVLEVDKVEYLRGLGQANNCKPLAFLFFTDNTLLVADLTKHYSTNSWEANQYTVISDAKTTKHFYELPIKGLNKYVLNTTNTINTINTTK